MDTVDFYFTVKHWQLGVNLIFFPLAAQQRKQEFLFCNGFIIPARFSGRIVFGQSKFQGCALGYYSYYSFVPGLEVQWTNAHVHSVEFQTELYTILFFRMFQSQMEWNGNQCCKVV